MAAKKYYAVQKGRTTGVFFSWAECQKQVTGFPGAVFKSFLTIEEAEAFAKGVQVASSKSLQDFTEKRGKGQEVLSVGEEPFKRILEMEPEALVAYVDGSYHSGTGEFSYGMVLLDSSGEQRFCEKFADKELANMRNVAGEIKGAEAAMRYAVEKGISKLYIFHDYEGIAKWCQGVWKTNKEGTRAYKAYYDSVQDKLEVCFVKVAAHTGEEFNELADQLAKEALGIER